MNNNKANVYVRLQAYYSLLTDLNDLDSDSPSLSVNALHEHTVLPVELIRNDLAQILKWQTDIELSNENNPLLVKRRGQGHIINYIFFDLDDTEYEDIQDYDDPKAITKEVSQLLLAGKLDDVPLYIDASSSKLFDLALTFDEATALEALNRDIRSESIPALKKYPVYFQIKDNYRAAHHYRELIDKLEKLEDAINHHYTLHMIYRLSNGEPLSIPLRPLKISYDESENLYCVLSFADGKIWTSRLDCITSLSKLSGTPDQGQKPTEDTAGEALIEKLAPQVWGNCFQDEPEHVKVRFYNEANVWEKVKRDLACRTKGQLYEKDGFLYYEDTVYGISKFRPWLYSFGSSAIVLEPKSLREHIIASLKERKDRDQI